MGAYEFGIADFDCNQTITLADLSAWPTCATDPAAVQSTIENRQSTIGCGALDFNADGAIDLADFAQFMRLLGVP